jgi:hypothetical protein
MGFRAVGCDLAFTVIPRIYMPVQCFAHVGGLSSRIHAITSAFETGKNRCLSDRSLALKRAVQLGGEHERIGILRQRKVRAVGRRSDNAKAFVKFLELCDFF